ncbi:MAG: ABC transporter permease [Verrucomicrobia bacterium]|nr:ABC transporter permease [Verrucomicrobiota bacterium]
MLTDLRYAIRMLLKNPGFTCVAVLTIALGIGANSAIFSQINELILRPMPVKDPEKLMALVLIDPQGDYSNQNIPFPICRDYQEQSRAFSDLVAYATVRPPMQVGETTARVPVQLASANFFSTLGVAPVLGRGFSAEEDRNPAGQVSVVISSACWQERFGADPGVIGKILVLRPAYVQPLHCTIVGVAPPWFHGLEPEAPEVWIPAVMEAHFKKSERVDFRLVGRLAPAITRKEAVAELNVVTRNIAEKYKGAVIPGYEMEGIFPSDLRVELRYAALGRWGAFNSHRTLRRAAVLAAGVVGVILLIACANLANLLLARAANRRKEIAMRLSLGASRSRLLRQMLTESVLLALVGGAFALVFGVWANQLLCHFKPSAIRLLVESRLDGNVILFTVGLSILTGLLFGMVPAWQAIQFDLNSALKEERAAMNDAGLRLHVRDALAAAQVGLCLLLLMGAGLCLRSFLELHSANHGFNVRNTMIASLNLKGTGSSEETARQILEQLVQSVKALPGVRSASFASSFPLLGDGPWSMPVFEIEGYVRRKDEFLVMEFGNVGPDYFETLQIPVLSSSGAHLRERGALAWVNESFVRRYWPGINPIGKRVGPYEVAGVVNNSRVKNLWEEPEPYVYVQYLVPPLMRSDQLIRRLGHLLVRTEGDPKVLLPALRQAIQTASSGLDASRIQTMRQVVSSSLVGQRFTLILLASFAATALLLAVIGLYGVMSYLVTQRTKEIGIRVALGAQRRHVLGLVLKRGLLLVSLGLALGLAGALASTRLMSGLLFGITPTDPATFVSVALLLAAIALLACYLPARRATQVDPIVALRYE